MLRLFIALLCLLSFSATASDKVLRIAFSEIDSFPNEYLEDGKLVGFHVELITEVAKQLGYQVETVRMPWRRIVRSLESGNIDAVSYTSGYKNFSHNAWLHDDNALSTNAFYLIKHQDNRKVRFKGDYDSLQGLRVAKLRGYQITLTEDNYTPYHIVNVDHEYQLLDLVKLKRVDAAIIARGYFSRDTLKEHDLELIPRPLSSVYSHIGFNKSTFEESFSLQFAKKMVAFRNTIDYMQLERKYAAKYIQLNVQK